MKKYLLAIVCLAVGILFVSSFAMAFTPAMANYSEYVAGSGITNSPHDLRSARASSHNKAYYSDPADGLDRICIFCHAPHHTYKATGITVGTGPTFPNSDYDYYPLWNHEPTSQNFEPYYNGPGAPQSGDKKAQSIVEAWDKIGGVSLLCLSCHDGTIAVSSYGTADQDSRSKGTGTLSAAGIGVGGTDVQFNIGKDAYLVNHHPIGFNYDTVQSMDKGINLSTNTFNTGDPVKNHLYGASNTQMECATCHSVHNKDNTGEKLLWRTDAASGLCLTCHIK